MRIAIFSDTYLPDKNGVSFSIDNFTKLLAADGHQIMIFCPKSGHYRDKQRPNIIVKRYMSFTAPSYKAMKVALPFVLSVTKELKEFDADVIHIQTPMGIGWIGIWASKILKIKNIQTYHSYIPDFLVYFKPKTLFGIDRMANYISSSRLIKALAKADISDEHYESTKLQPYLDKKIKDITEKASKSEVNKATERFGRDFTRAVYNRADLILTPSHAMLRVLKKQGIKPKTEVLSNGIEYDYFKKKTDYTVKNRIINIGRLGYEKSVDVVIRAFALALKSNPKLRLDIYGDGPAKGSLQALTKVSGVNREVKFHGAYNIEKLSQHLCDYDYFVTASTIETQGVVLLEAMASGLPVLGANKLAVPEVVIDGQNGYLSRPADEHGMAKNMLKMTESSARLEQFGKKSLAIAKSHEITKCKDKLVSIYERVARG